MEQDTSVRPFCASLLLRRVPPQKWSPASLRRDWPLSVQEVASRFFSAYDGIVIAAPVKDVRRLTSPFFRNAPRSSGKEQRKVKAARGRRERKGPRLAFVERGRGRAAPPSNVQSRANSFFSCRGSAMTLGRLLWCAAVMAAASPSEAAADEACQKDDLISNLQRWSSSDNFSVSFREEEDFDCRLSPANVLNCSWDLAALPAGARLSVSIRCGLAVGVAGPGPLSERTFTGGDPRALWLLFLRNRTGSICHHDGSVGPLHLKSEERFGSASVTLGDEELLHVIILFNASLRQDWSALGYGYEVETMEVLPSPANVRARLKDADLVVTWDAPLARTSHDPGCFQYQLVVGRQVRRKRAAQCPSANKSRLLREGPPFVGHQEERTFEGVRLSCTISGVDPAADLSVKLRVRTTSHCLGSSSWSGWSRSAATEISLDGLNVTWTVWIALGVPVVLVTLFCLLRVHRLRVTQVLYPTIPRPPLKYKYFLEENFYQTAPSAKSEEEIAMAEDAGNPFQKSSSMQQSNESNDISQGFYTVASL
ncbi:uncharacterized protein LOC133510895 isoform X3 [Syngnathoides biaculeatus]|uniref:uncharacterized protein LOC133510895 isoform X3 n=1 Tax=Syngnathoides biaculeatus TaxID=300417 RepID=UPI002ADDABA8|nr:uncharacterized protein LOC133510895 isoform X3 [Syngnathoides biaculeatus]